MHIFYTRQLKAPDSKNRLVVDGVSAATLQYAPEYLALAVEAYQAACAKVPA